MASRSAWCLPRSHSRVLAFSLSLAFFTDGVTVSSPQDLLKVNGVFDLCCAFGESDLARIA